jgi:hypothetical protein
MLLRLINQGILFSLVSLPESGILYCLVKLIRGFEIPVQLICTYQFRVIAITYGFDHVAAGKLPFIAGKPKSGILYCLVKLIRGFEMPVQLICTYLFRVLAITYGFDHVAAGKLPSIEPIFYVSLTGC